MKFRICLIIISFLFSTAQIFAEDGLRTQFLNNQTIIYGLNIRNFNSKDLNKNGVIDENEESGNFINAVKRLDELKDMNINTLMVFPVTPVGKIKALGTAGSLYAISDFTQINPQLADKNSSMNPYEQAKYFINECHKRGIKVIIDLPCCGSYDLFLTRPELFLTDEKGLSIVPANWNDVRLFNTGDNENLNEDLFEEHKKFVDMVLGLGADGIRADVPSIKPYKFWEELIKYTREKNPEFLYLAEASDSWNKSPSEYAQFTPYDKLLEAGFDGYYGSFFNLKDWRFSSELFEHLKFNKKLLSSYPEKKSAILSFTTHDEVSPVLIKDENFPIMICWLEATLPYNPYIIDGFQTGDDYIYPLANAKLNRTETDDDYFFVHRGKLDIFNFSRKPGGKYANIKDNYERAMAFRTDYEDLITKGNFTPLKTYNDRVFAYVITKDNLTAVVIGNLYYKNGFLKLQIKLPSEAKKQKIYKTIQGTKITKIKKGQIYTDIRAGEIKVLLMGSF